MRKALIVIAATFASPSWAQTSGIIGHWEHSDGDRRVEITDCGDGTPCGHITWIAAGNAEEMLDRFNPDPAFRDRSLVGIPVLWGFRETKKGWKNGRVYDWSCGDTLGSRLRLDDPETLKVKGCSGPVCLTQKWHRVAQTKPSIQEKEKS